MRKPSVFKRILAVAITSAIVFVSFSATALAEGEEERAARFISAVEEFSELADLDEKKSHLATVKSAEIYFSDESYDGVTEALASLAQYEALINEAVANCDAFIDAVDTALMTDVDDYEAFKAALTEAEKYFKKLDSTYDGILGAQSDYKSMSGELTEREKYTEDFLKAVEKIATATDYNTRLEAYNDAEEYIEGESFIATYPGVAEALATLEATDALLEEAVAEAGAFVSLISRLGTGDNIVDELLAAYAALAQQDITAPGVSMSKLILDTATEAYNASVHAVNEDWSNL